MADRLSDRLDALLETAQGKEVSLASLRTELRIDPTSPAWNSLRVLMYRRVETKIVKASGRSDGVYKVIRQIKAISVYGRERRPPVGINFPRAQDTGEEFCFAQDIVFREGDLILLSGQSNKGKTTLCMNFCAENIDSKPVLMGNEYTTLDDEPAPRFLSRLDSMDWVQWFNEDGQDNFTLLPVRDDYAEHIVKDKMNIIDWINLDANMLYGISAVMADIKRASGKGTGVIAIQKKEGEGAGRGGQFTKDFADCELLLDQYQGDEILLTIGKVKEYKRRVTGRKFAYAIADGVRIVNFREVRKCNICNGAKIFKGSPCANCNGTGYVDMIGE